MYVFDPDPRTTPPFIPSRSCSFQSVLTNGLVLGCRLRFFIADFLTWGFHTTIRAHLVTWRVGFWVLLVGVLGVSVGFYSRVYGCYVWVFCGCFVGVLWGKLALGCWSYVVVIDAGWMLRCMRLSWRWVFLRMEI